MDTEAKSLRQKIDWWKDFPNALQSEGKVAILVGEVAAKLGEEIPPMVMEALRSLSFRGSMRDVASDVLSTEDCMPRVGVSAFQHFVDPVAATSRISWGEALAVIAKYFDERSAKLEER